MWIYFFFKGGGHGGMGSGVIWSGGRFRRTHEAKSDGLCGERRKSPAGAVLAAVLWTSAVSVVWNRSICGRHASGVVDLDGPVTVAGGPGLGGDVIATTFPWLLVPRVFS
jgi:hypothetical protein